LKAIVIPKSHILLGIITAFNANRHLYILLFFTSQTKGIGSINREGSTAFNFKWEFSVLKRLKEVVFQKKDYTGYWEYKKIFYYLKDNLGRININDERFMIERCGKNYTDYRQWDKIKVQSLEYRI